METRSIKSKQYRQIFSPPRLIERNFFSRFRTSSSGSTSSESKRTKEDLGRTEEGGPSNANIMFTDGKEKKKKERKKKKRNRSWIRRSKKEKRKKQEIEISGRLFFSSNPSLSLEYPAENARNVINVGRAN